MPTKKASTIQDVADKAKVSIKTVSRVINNEPNVSLKTVKKVETAINFLDYQPNAFAQSLARSKPKIISLIYDTPSPNYISHIMEGVLSYCYKVDYEVIIHPLRFNEVGLMRSAKQFIKKSRLAGLIVTPPYSDSIEFIKLIESFDLPKVLISSGLNISEEDSIKTNDREVSMQMTDYLISKGHRRIAFIKGHPTHLCINDRFKGYQEAMNRAGIEIDNSIVENGLNSLSSGEQCAERLLSLKERPTAIFSSNDEMAAGVIKVAYRNGLNIPSDLSVVGFDDSPMTAMITPPLTTVKQPLDAIGEKSAKKLIDKLENKELIQESVINSNIIYRDSVKKIS